jgi:tetratricopeptide (TPR) repeat protein
VEEILGYHPGQEFLEKVKVPSGRELESRIRKEKDFLQARIADLGLDNLHATPDVRVGTPFREITRQAKSGRYDLLVIGSVGRRDNPRVYLGRTAKKVAERLHCATLFLRDADVWQSQIEEDIEEIARNYRKARQLIKQRKFKMAIRKLRRCLSKAPYFAPALEQLSKAYQQTGYKAEADALSKKAKLIREKLKR